MEKYDAAIIGSGLGGLQCAYILAKCGMKVIVLEKNPTYIGGCLQTFKRGGMPFDTGFHYVGGLDDGQPLNRIFRYFGLMDLPWKKMDTACFDEVFYKGKSYKFRNGYANFLDQMAEYFPHQREALEKYVADLRDTGDNIFDGLSRSEEDVMAPDSPFMIKAIDYLRATFSDPDLINVLSGTSPKLPLSPSLPLYHFLQINASFIQSAYRLQGGGMQIAESLARQIEATGNAKIVRGANVERLRDSGDGIIRYIDIEGMEPIETGIAISNIHPAALMPMIKDTKVFRPFQYRSHSRGANSFGMFTANIALKPGALKYINRNIYIHEGSDVWAEAWQGADAGPKCALVSFAVPSRGDYADNVDILTPMLWQDVARYDGTRPMQRGSEYEDFKIREANQLIAMADKYIPGLADSVSKIYTSTPLTYKDYIGTAEGSAFGLLEKKMSQKLSLGSNIYWTGQNIGLHGFLGVSMTSLLTVKWILGRVPEI